MPSYSSDNQVLCDVLPHQVLREQTLQPAKLIFMLDLEVFEAWANERSWVPDDNVVDDTPVIEKYKLPPIQIFDKNCPLKRVNQKFAIFRQNVRKLELIW